MSVSCGQALDAFEDAGYRLLDVRPAHVFRLETLVPLHKDPFDRLLIAQAVVEALTLITHDATVGRYGGDIVQV